ncbi:MAG: ATP phosphoribosyltransferase [Planctomycetaceae bacterium]|nr:ATP phosphoribosyltransferase [Planctomycetaceae bacterium]
MSHLRLGIPSKGRLSELSDRLLNDAGIKFRRTNRSLFAKAKDLPLEIAFLRSDDIPVLCAEGAIDMGITGSDLVEEAGVEVHKKLALGEGVCRLSICIPDDSPIQSPQDMAGCRIATSFPHVTQKFFDRLKCPVTCVRLSGSVEVMVSLGVADAIVDLVETGSTLAANRLRVLADIGQYETILIANQRNGSSELAERITRRLEGVVIARGYSLVEFNIERSQVPAAHEIAPGFHSPTINPLEDPEWCAVRVMVKRSLVIDVMERLEAIGATAILETQIANCRL